MVPILRTNNIATILEGVERLFSLDPQLENRFERRERVKHIDEREVLTEFLYT